MINQFETQLNVFIQTQDIPSSLIKEAIHYVLFPGGKRLRPMLVYLTCEMLQLPDTISHPIAIAIELIHAYSLVHDDLPAMDNDDFRRGRPSCHRAFDEATAILTGDALHALSLTCLTDCFPASFPTHLTLKMIKALLLATGPTGMVSGQSLDLTDLVLSHPISEQHLSTIHQLKTGGLIKACIQLPLLACSEEKQMQFGPALLSFAQNFGLAYQVQDDYLDAYHSDLLGKHHPSDAANQKQTFATLYDKQALHILVEQSFQTAIDSLSCFGEKANALIYYIQELRK